MIVTTTPSVDGKVIESYLGLVSGSALHNVGGILGEGYLDSSQSTYISSDIASATKRMISQAIALKADAIVGVQVSTGASAAANQIITTCIGTAVKLAPTAEELARIEKEKQEKAAAEAAAEAERAERIEKLAAMISENTSDPHIVNFCAGISGYNRYMQILDEWTKNELEGIPAFADIEKELKNKAYAERMYGPNRDTSVIEKYKACLIEKLTGKPH